MITISGGDLAKIRSQPYFVKRRVSLIPRNAIYTARVNGTPERDPHTNAFYYFDFDGGSGTLADVKVGMTIDIGSSAGARDVGSVRVRKAPTSSRFYISESSHGEVPIFNDHFITVREEFKIWQILPRLVGIKNSQGYTTSFLEYHDFDLEYTDENKIIDPIVNIVGRPAGWVDEGQSYRTMQLLVDHEIMTVGASLASLSWDIGDASFVSGFDSNDAIIQIRVPGSTLFRYISCTIVDTAGASFTHYFPVWVHSDANPPYQYFEILRDETEFSRTMSIRFFFDSPNIRKDDLVCYWEEADFDGDSPPATYRDQFLGWVTDRTNALKRYSGDVVFTVVSGTGILDTLGGFPETVTDKDDPQKWYEMENVTIDRMVHYILRRYTTFLSVCNLILAGDDTEALSETTKQTSIWQQITDMVQGYCGIAAGDSLNNLYIFKHFSYLSADDRTARGTLVAISPTDLSDSSGLDIQDQLTQSIAQINMSGSYYDGTESFLKHSKAPGLTPSYGTEIPDGPFQRLPTTTPQAVLNQRAGHHWKRMVNPRPDNSVVLMHNMDAVEPAWNTPVQITWSHSHIADFSITELFLVKRISIQHANGQDRKQKRITWQVEQVTTGLPGSTYVPAVAPPRPDDPVIDNPPITTFPDITFPPIDVPPYPWQIPAGTLPNAIFYLGSDDGGVYLGKEYDVLTGAINWEAIGGSARGITGTPLWATADPYRYRRYFVLTSNGLYYCDDALDGPYSWSLVANNLAMFGDASWVGNCIRPTIAREGYFAITSGPNLLAVTEDYGDTWEQLMLPFSLSSTLAGSASAFNTTHCIVAISPFGEGRMYGSIVRVGGGFFSTACSILRSDDWGNSWTQEHVIGGGNFQNQRSAALNIPYKRDASTLNENDSNQLVYATTVGNFISAIARKSGGSWSNLTTSAGTVPDNARQNGIHSFTNDGRIAMLPIEGSSLITSPDALTTRTTIPISFSPGLLGYGGEAPNLNGWPNDDTIMLGFFRNYGLFRLNVTTGVATRLSNTDLPTDGFGNQNCNYAELMLAGIIGE